MSYAIILGIMAAVLAVKAYTIFSIGHLEKVLRDLKLDDEDVTGKIDALDGTRTKLERDHKDILSEMNRLDVQKNQLVVEIQKHGVTPVPEPSLVLPPADPPPVSPQTPEDAGSTEAELEVESEVETVPEEAELGGEGETDPDGSDEAEDSRPRVLIVDDNGDLRDLLSESFSEAYLVDRAADGLEALNFILKEERRYDAIITDLNMPNLDGMTFLANVPDGMRVIVMSAYLDRPEFEAATDHERVYCTIEKPFKLATIREAVNRLIAEQPAAAAVDPEKTPETTEPAKG